MPKAYEPKMRRDRATPRTSFARRRAIRLPERNCFLARRRRAEHMGENLTYRDSAGEHPSKRKRCAAHRSEEHTSELQSLMRISYAVFCLKKKKKQTKKRPITQTQSEMYN